MKVLVTGGTGYIGSHVSQRLRETGCDVVIYDNLSNSFEQAALGGRLVVGDLADERSLSQTFDDHEFDAVMHFAASIYAGESVDQPLAYYDNNLTGLLRLLHQCRRRGVRYFVFSSTAAVYAPTTGAITEEMPLAPPNPYGWSKRMGEQILLDEQRVGSIRAAVLRYYNAAGADPEGRIGPSGEAKHLIKVALQAALGVTDGMTIYGTDYDTSDGTCIRDYIHVSDLAQIHADALAYLSKNNSPLVLNCGYGHGYSVREIIATVKRVTGVDFSVHEGARRAGDASTLVADNRRLRSVLGWTPAYDDIEAIVRDAWGWEKSRRPVFGAAECRLL